MNNMFSNAKAMPCNTRLRLTNGTYGANCQNMGKRILALALLGVSGSGCVQVAAPDKPIVINLNIGIQQEVLYKLDEASKKMIAENSGVF
jgi:YnbE-like lipoprotein